MIIIPYDDITKSWLKPRIFHKTTAGAEEVRKSRKSFDVLREQAKYVEHLEGVLRQKQKELKVATGFIHRLQQSVLLWRSASAFINIIE